MFNIYKLTHRLTREVYVGATCNLRSRMQTRFQPKGEDAQFFVAPHLWDLHVIALAFTAEEAAAMEAEEQAKVPVVFRVASLNRAGAGLKDAAKATHWPRDPGPVELKALLRSAVDTPAAMVAVQRERQVQSLNHYREPT
jgi:hypothetical protein